MVNWFGKRGFFRVDFRMLLHSQTGERFFERYCVDDEPAAVGLHILQFVEGTEKAEFGGGVLFRFGEWTCVSCGPRGH